MFEGKIDLKENDFLSEIVCLGFKTLPLCIRQGFIITQKPQLFYCTASTNRINSAL